MGTKWESYQQEFQDMPAKRLAVVRAALEHPGSSRADLAEHTSLRLSSVCGRVNELLESGQLMVSGKKFDAQTNRNVEVVSVVVAKKQLEMF